MQNSRQWVRAPQQGGEPAGNLYSKPKDWLSLVGGRVLGLKGLVATIDK